MSFFSKLFGGDKKSTFEMAPTSVMMDENRYWQLIADSLANTNGEQDAQASYLTRELEKLPPAEIVGFRLCTDKLLYDTYNSDMWCAGYVMNGGCSDDGFEYFRLWIISRGREAFENARANPDSLAVVHGGTVEDLYDFETFWYVANNAFHKVTGKDLYEYINNENFKTSEASYQRDFEFTWQEDDVESMKKICPKLVERFAHFNFTG